MLELARKMNNIQENKTTRKRHAFKNCRVVLQRLKEEEIKHGQIFNRCLVLVKKLTA
jgi:hypothetical protein